MRPFPKARVDALTDSIFAFSMTLLVVDIRIPEGLEIANAAELSRRLAALMPQAVAYVISFFVLAALWRNLTAMRHDTEEVARGPLQIRLCYLLLVTMVPFSSALVGRYGHFPPAVWVYAGNMAALGLLSLLLHRIDVPQEIRTQEMPAQARMGEWRMALFVGSAVASALVSLWAPHYAMYAYFLNALPRVPPFR